MRVVRRNIRRNSPSFADELMVERGKHVQNDEAGKERRNKAVRHPRRIDHEGGQQRLFVRTDQAVGNTGSVIGCIVLVRMARKICST